ncbi:CAS1 domain-containing 1 [Brachionus plicatilis]|uniref:CAS1 domain-containing 1 n=1 Tax=Brachionus plicatilis TaxID=10195 RepID=A0A3M7T9B1_BRAPC|nr:CAS1 domain-containing 1 [Brachionus plicatilis]
MNIAVWTALNLKVMDIVLIKYFGKKSQFNIFLTKILIFLALFKKILKRLYSHRNNNKILKSSVKHYLNLNLTIKESISLFRQNVTSFVNLIKSYDNNWKNKLKHSPIQSIGDISWSWSEPSPIYWMLQDKLDEYKYYFNRTYNSQFTNDELDEFNRVSIDLLYNSPVNIWSSNRLVSKNMYQDSVDGFLIGKKALKVDTQILLNLYCNSRMDYKDASCCAQPETITILQKIIFLVFIIIFIVFFVLFLYRYFFIKYQNYRINMFGPEISLTPGCKSAASSYGFYGLFKALAEFAFFMFYFFACDRANYFMKENKHFSLLTFLTPFIYVFIVGIFFQDKLPLAKVMNRYQTDELKGFMQIFILFYRLSGAEKNTVLYLTMRLFTGAYLFLSGYGHFMYFWNTSNFAITRLFELETRLQNLDYRF